MHENQPAGTTPELPASPQTVDLTETRRRFRFTMRVASIACLSYGITFIAIGYAWPLGIGDLLWTLELYLLQRWALAEPDGRRLKIGAHLMALSGCLLLSWHSYYLGMGSAFTTWDLCAVPIAVALMGNMAMLAFWTLMTLVLIVLIHVVGAVWPVTPLLVPSGNMTAYMQMVLVLITAFYSVSALRANEQHLAILRDSYGALLAQRNLLDTQTQKLNRALHEAEDARTAADAANKEKSAFLATMSHEIRTPLNGVIGLNSLLLDLPLDEKARQYAELGRHSGEILLALVNDVLDFSRIEAGQLALEKTVMKPAAVIEDAMVVLQQQAREKGLLLVSECEAPPAIIGDPQRLRQILLNLISNAVKFTASGEVRLRCFTLRQQDTTAWLRIEVRDTGIGINPATQASLFRPFIQADASTTRRYGGSGLGLAICRGLAQSMGGSIGVESRLGEGSTFWVELPFDTRVSDAAVAFEAPASHAGRFSGRVLVVEDNPVNQVVAREMLERLGVAVDCVADGEQAVRSARAHDYDLVLMDCEMPVLDGFDATRAIRAFDGPRSQVKIIAMTARVLGGDREKCRDAGMNDYLAKPMRIRDLEQILGRWLPSGRG